MEDNQCSIWDTSQRPNKKTSVLELFCLFLPSLKTPTPYFMMLTRRSTEGFKVPDHNNVFSKTYCILLGYSEWRKTIATHLALDLCPLLTAQLHLFNHPLFSASFISPELLSGCPTEFLLILRFPPVSCQTRVISSGKYHASLPSLHYSLSSKSDQR